MGFAGAAVLAALTSFLPVRPEAEAKPALPAPADVSRRLDALFEKGWADRRLAPSPDASDAEFLRRLSLDLRGTIPAPDEVSAFLADRAADKRARKTADYLASPEHADYFARVFTETLIGGGDLNRELRPEVLKDWLEDAFAANRPWNEIVRDLVGAEGKRSESGPANFILRWAATPEDLAGATSRLFLGTQIQCAQCHQHPYEKWSRDDFYGIAAFFARTKREVVPAANPRDRDFRVVERGRGEVFIEEDPAESKPKRRVGPRLLDGTPLAAAPRANRRRALADWIASPRNESLAPAFVNRLVAHLFGRGFVAPVDDFNSKNPPSHPEALSLLAADFVASNHDVRRALAILAGTRAYALSSAPAPGNAKDFENEGFARARLRPLDADQLFNALVAATGVGPPRAPRERAASAAPPAPPAAESGAEEAMAEGGESAPMMAPPMAPAAAAPPPPDEPDERANLDPLEALRRRFVAAVRAAQAEEEPEAGFSESIPKMLLLLNGGLVNEGVRARRAPRRGGKGEERALEGSRTVERIAGMRGGAGEKVEALYLAALSRPPSGAEIARGKKALAAEKRPAQGLEDLFWALLNSSEFAFNH